MLARAARCSPAAFLCRRTRDQFWCHYGGVIAGIAQLDTAAAEIPYLATTLAPVRCGGSFAEPIAAAYFCFCIAALRVQAAAADAEKKSNPMRNIRIEKLVINCCVGESGDRLTRAAKVRTFGRPAR
jgi:hypothetical protein